MSEIPNDIFQTSCGIVMGAKSCKSMSKHRDIVDAVALALSVERSRSFSAGWNLAGGDHTQQEAFREYNGRRDSTN